jgi:amidase
MSSDFVFQDAVELSRKLQSREVSAREALEAHLQQIDRVNHSVNAVCTLSADQAMETAQKLDNGPVRGPLHGMPIGVKDLSPTKGIRSTFGSPIYADWVPDFDALPVTRIKQAGAVIVGKTNTPEFGAGSQTFNKVFGTTLNPYDTSRTCGGSSGGSAVALACGMVPLATGSDLGGSLRNPAAWCNVVGIRTSVGRVPSYPTTLGYNSLSVQGPMGRTVDDVALQLSVLAGPDDRIPNCLPEPGKRFASPLERSLKGVRVAWSPDLGFPVDASIKATLEKQRRVFEDLGCIVEEATPDLSDADEIFHVFRAYKFASDYKKHLEEQPEKLKDTVIWNIREGLKLSAMDLAEAEIKRTRLHERMAAFFSKYEFLLCPVTSVQPFSIEQEYVTEINGVKLDNYIKWMATCYAITVTGNPAMSVPAGFTDDGLPVGLQIVGGYQKDFAVLQMGKGFETATQFGRVRPSVVAANG